MRFWCLQDGTGAGATVEDSLCYGVDGTEDGGEAIRGVDVRRAIEGEDHLFAWRQAVQREFSRVIDLLAQRVNHGVAHEVDLFGRDAFAAEVVTREGVGCEQKVRNSIRA